jgi:hypothetical protein
VSGSADDPKENSRNFYAIDDFGLELALLERGSSRRTTVMRYPTRAYQSDSSSLPLGRSDDRINAKGGGFAAALEGAVS